MVELTNAKLSFVKSSHYRSPVGTGGKFLPYVSKKKLPTKKLLSFSYYEKFLPQSDRKPLKEIVEGITFSISYLKRKSRLIKMIFRTG